MLGYGQFLTALVNFLILAFIIYQLVKAASRMKKA
jgi:large-conductance mechanosensitive channel